MHLRTNDYFFPPIVWEEPLEPPVLPFLPPPLLLKQLHTTLHPALHLLHPPHHHHVLFLLLFDFLLLQPPPLLWEPTRDHVLPLQRPPTDCS